MKIFGGVVFGSKLLIEWGKTLGNLEIKRLYENYCFNIEKPQNVKMKYIIEYFKKEIKKNDGIAGDEVGGEFHIGWTLGRYDVDGNIISVSLLDKAYVDSYVGIAREIREKFEKAIMSV